MSNYSQYDYVCTNPECGAVRDCEQKDAIYAPCPECRKMMKKAHKDGDFVVNSKCIPEWRFRKGGESE